MILKALIFIFIVVVVIALVIKFTVLYHFKKFSLPEDPMCKKILKLHKQGTIVLSLLGLIFLIIFIVIK